MILWASTAALLLAAVHVFSNVLRILDGLPRSRFLSIAAGVSIAFVFLQLLPSLASGQAVIEQTAEGGWLAALDRHVYAVGLGSLVLFYALERVARASRAAQSARGGADRASVRVFWLHMATFGIMNALIGYLLVRAHANVGSLASFTTGIFVKFVVNDHGLHQAHKEGYDRIGRWLLAAAVVVGWAIGSLTALPSAAVPVIQAFLAGAVLLNVLKEELPAEREARMWAFAIGAITYGVLLLLLA